MHSNKTFNPVSSVHHGTRDGPCLRFRCGIWSHVVFGTLVYTCSHYEKNLRIRSSAMDICERNKDLDGFSKWKGNSVNSVNLMNP